MAGLDPNEYVNRINFSATHVLQRHMDPPSFEATWAKFVLSTNKWLRQQGRKEYDKVDLANMRGGQDGATEKILTDLGHKGCLVADLIGILEDAEMHDILRSEEFKLRLDRTKAALDKCQTSTPPGKIKTSDPPKKAIRLYQSGSPTSKDYRRKRTMHADESDGEDEEYATASSGDEVEGGVSSQHCVSLVTTERGTRKQPPSAQGASQSKETHGRPSGSITGFAIVTANPTEEKAVRHFLQLGGSSGEVWEGASECIWKNDPYLKSNGITVTYKGVVEGCNYELFTLTREGGSERVFGVHIKCLQQAAFTEEGAQDTAATLLMHAKEWKWQLTDVFSVGCCGYADDSKCEENLMGYVLLANQFEAYLNRGKMAAGDLQHHPEVYRGDRQWVSDLQDHRITKPMRQSGADVGKLKNIPVKEVPRIESGPLVVKSDEYAQQLRGASYRSGIEMEAIGFIKALRFYEKQGNQIVPNFVSVKGVSDFGKGKSSKAETTFFGQKTAALSDGERQQVATLHSIALVIRGVVERYLVPRPVVNPKDLL